MDPKIRKSAEETFKAHPKADKILVTTDGHSFMPEAKNMAGFHARRNGLKVIEVTREELSKKTSKNEGGSGEGATKTPKKETGSGKSASKTSKKESGSGKGATKTDKKEFGSNEGSTKPSKNENGSGKGTKESKE